MIKYYQMIIHEALNTLDIYTVPGLKRGL